MAGTVLLAASALGPGGRSAVAAPTASGCTDESVSYQINPAHTGVQNDGCLQPSLSRAWTLTLPGTISYPIITGGRVFVTAADAIPPDSSGTPHTSSLYAFDLGTGTQLWSTELGGSYQNSNATYENGRLFTVNADGDMRAFDAATGAQLWHDDPNGTGAKLPNAGPGTYGGAVPVAFGGYIYLDGGSDNLVAVDEINGSIKWTTSSLSQGGMPSVAADGVYYTFPQNNVLKRNLTTGATIWNYLTGTSGGGAGASVVTAGKVWVYDGQIEGNAPLLDASTGKVVTANGTWGPNGVAYAIPVIDSTAGIAIYRMQNGWIEAVDLSTNSQLWSFGEDGPAIPVIANGYVYVETREGVIYALDERTGRQVWYDYRFYQTSGSQNSYGPDSAAIGIGQGMLVAPAGNLLMAYRSSGNGPWAPPSFTPIPNQPDQAVAYHIDVAHSGAQYSDSLKPPLARKWSRVFEGPVSYPLIANGMVFVTVGRPFDQAIDDSRLYALDAATGNVLYGPYEVGGSLNWSGLAYDQGRLITLNSSGWLKEFVAHTGIKLWAKYLGPGPWDTSPVARNGTIYVAKAGDSYTASPARLLAIDEASAQVKWSRPVESTGAGQPGLSGTSVYTAFCQNVADFDATTGSPHWDSGAGTSLNDCTSGRAAVIAQANVYNRDLFGGGVVYSASNTPPAHRVGTFSASTLPAFDASGLGFYVSNAGIGTLEAHKVSGAGFAWSFAGDGSLSSEPVLANGYVYVGTAKGNLYVLNESTGKPVWWTNLGAAFNTPTDGGAASPVPAMAIGAGMLVAPVTNKLVAFRSGGAPPASTLPLAHSAPVAPQANYFWHWVSGSGSASDIGVTGLQTAWDIGTNMVSGGYGINQWAWDELRQDYRWIPVAGGALRVSVASDGLPWVVNSSGGIFERWGNRWIHLPGLARDIGNGGDGSIWVIGTTAVTGGYTIYRWAAGTGGWQQIPGSGVRIAVDPAGNAWVVRSSGTIFRHDRSGWHQVAGCARDIGAANSGTASIWIVSCTKTAGGYVVDYFDPASNSWRQVSGQGATRITVNALGHVWVVTANGSVYRRDT